MSEEVTIEIGAEAVADADIDDAVAVAVADAVADEVVTTDLLATEALNAVALAAESAAESAAAEVAAAEVAADDDSSVAEKVTVYFENVEENIEKAIKLVRDEGMYVAKAAGQTGVPIKKLEAIVKDMKERGELTMNWDSRRVETTPRVDKEGKVIQRKKRRFVDWNYTTEDVHAAANAVKNGEYSVKGAYKAFKIPVRDIKRAMKGEEVKGRICTPKFIRLRKRGKLTEEEEKVVMEYAFALNKLKHPITYKTMAPLAKQLLKLRDETLADEKGWWIAFVKRHQELEGLYQTPLQLTALANHRHHWAKQYFSRLVEVFENGEFFSKPSRIYACEIEQFEVERWESDCAKLVEVEMLVAANAVGYHVLPPCVVYASEGEDIPDFLGLPEAGFVAAEEKKVSAAILAEWFRSVFLHYLPSRSADDPVMLILKGTNEWLTPELITMAEQQFVHLVPMHSKVLKYLSPIQPLLHSLKEAYKEKLSQYKQTELRRQAESPAKEAFFPVTFRKLFSNCFSMYEIQEVFRTRGVFPLKPDEADLGIKDDPPKQEGKKKKKWIPIKEQYPRSYAEMVKNDIIFVPPPRLVPANIPQMPMTYSTTAGGLFYNHLGVPVQLNQLVGQNQVVAGTNIVGPTGMIVNANGTVVPNPLLSKVITTQPSVVIPTSVPPLTEAAKNAKLSKAFSPEVLNIAKEVKNRTPVTIVQPQVPKANAETEQVKRSKLSKAFSNDVLSTVIKVAKENEDQERKAELYRTRRSGVLSSTVSESVSETLSTTETNESVTSDTTENSNDASQGDDMQDAANSTSAASGDSGDASPPILVTIREASETGSIDTHSSEEEPKSKNASESTVASISKSPTTRSKAKEIATTSPSTPVKVSSPNTRSASKEIADTSSSTPSGSKASSLSTRSASKEVTTTSPSTPSKASLPSTRSASAPSKEVTATSPSTPSKASLPSTRSASKKASPDVTSPLSDTPVRSTTRSKGNLMSKLISTGALGTQSDFEEEEEDDDFDPEVVSSDWDSDEERSSSRLQKSPRTKSSDEKSRKKKPQKKKSREETVPAPPPVLPKLTLAPNVTVPTSVVDRIQSMITDNTSLLTTLDEEEEEKKKKPKEPKVKHDPSKESVEARISKAFNADVLSSVLAVKQELAKRPKIPDRYAAPMQTVPALNVLYTLPGGGQVLLPASSFLPVAQRPVVVNPITQLAPGMTLVPVSTATPVKAGDKSSTAEDSNAAPSGKMKGKGKKQETKEGKKSKGKKESKGKKDTEENEATKNAKSKNKSVKDQAKGTKKSVVDDDDVNKEQSSNQEEIVVRKSARKRSVVMPDTETVTMDDSPTSPKSGSEKLTGARKRKASLLAKQGENAAAKEHAKKIKVENEGSGLSSGRTTRAKRSETKGSDKRVESTGTGKRIRTLKVKMNL